MHTGIRGGGGSQDNCFPSVLVTFMISVVQVKGLGDFSSLTIEIFLNFPNTFVNVTEMSAGTKPARNITPYL